MYILFDVCCTYAFYSLLSSYCYSRISKRSTMLCAIFSPITTSVPKFHSIADFTSFPDLPPPPPPSACLAVKPCLRGMVPPASYTSYLTQTSNSRILRLIQIAILLFFVIALTRFHFGLTLRICLKAQNKVQMPTYVLVSD